MIHWPSSIHLRIRRSFIEQEMKQWQITFPINGLHDVIRKPNTETFSWKYSENSIYLKCSCGQWDSGIVDTDKENDAEKESVCQINTNL